MPTVPLKVAVFAYPGVMMSATLGIQDILSHTKRASPKNPIEVEVLHSPTDSLELYRAIILPPAQKSIDPKSCPQVTTWLQAQHNQGAILCSACAGLSWIADTGLLEGRTATTHWALAAEISRRYPALDLDVDRLLIEHTDIITAGGMMAWMDLSLLLIERLIGQGSALATARHFVIDPGRRDQRRYKRFLPDLTHPDRPIRRAQLSIEQNLSTPVAMQVLASHAGLAPRTFLRRFKLATGLSPKDYIQHLKVEKARDMLLQTQSSVAEIAYKVGYQDQTAFARVFQKIAGESPSAFRAHYRATAGI